MSTCPALQLLPTQAAAAPGGRLEVRLNVTNSSDIGDRFRIEVAGVPEGWCDQDVSTVLLLPEETKAVHLFIHPPVGLSTKERLYPLTITAVSEIDDEARTSVEFSLTVLVERALQFDLSPKQITGRRALFRAKLQNR